MVPEGWVDVPLGRLEQYQRPIDPVAPPGDAAAATALTARTADQHGVLITGAPYAARCDIVPVPARGALVVGALAGLE
jgi:hypothetical protein